MTDKGRNQKVVGGEGRGGEGRGGEGRGARAYWVKKLIHYGYPRKTKTPALPFQTISGNSTTRKKCARNFAENIPRDKFEQKQFVQLENEKKFLSSPTPA